MRFIQLTLFSLLLGCGMESSYSKENIYTSRKNYSLAPPDTLFVDSMIFSDYFSPNGDGINDVFEIKNVHLYPNNQLKIYNRLGETVFVASPYINDWDGRTNQSNALFKEEVSDGIYLFDFLSGTGQRASGKITLRR